MLNVLLKKKYLSKFRFSHRWKSFFIYRRKKGQFIIYNNTAGVNDASIEHSFVSSKSVNSSVDSLDDTLQSQKIEVSDKIEVEFDSDPISRIEKIIIVVYQTKKVEVRHIFQRHNRITIQDADWLILRMKMMINVFIGVWNIILPSKKNIMID